jgi:HD-GYP domain-containing protein (c-di-GMP phosphodiesterase class II)
MDSPTLREQLLHQNLKVRRRAAPVKECFPYLPFALKALMVGERVSFPIYLKVSTGNNEVKFLPYLEEGEVVEPEWLAALHEAGVDRIYVRKEDGDRLVAYLNNHLLLVSEKEGPPEEKFTVLREHLTFSLFQAYRDPRMSENVRLARKSLENLNRFLWQEGFPWTLVWEMLYRDYSLYHHSVNVSVMGMALMAFLKKGQQEGLTLGLAGLFHDVGMIYLSEEIFHKSGPLEPEERGEVMKHPCYGYRLLKGNPLVPLESLRLILEHHENANGTGYPQGLTLARQHPHTRFLYMLEAFDSLTNFRPYRPAYTPFAALKIFQDPDQGLVCEPRALKLFIQFLALA